jgi:Tfp pilus assembly protein PilF/mono/diheme cytochrome c family protein
MSIEGIMNPSASLGPPTVCSMDDQHHDVARFYLVGFLSVLAIALSGCQRTVVTAAPPAPVAKHVTFNRDVAPILFANCSSCHRPGDAAPFSLLTFEDARKRFKQIAEVTRRRFMPPWQPAPGHGEFIGTRRLSDEQIETLDEWAKAGAPRGEPADLPAAPNFVEGWQLGKPDLVLESPAYKLMADGGDQFRNFVIPIDIKTPQWVESIELRPTNPRATHHARLGVDRTLESVRRDANDRLPGYEGMAWGQDPDGQLVTWIPGMVAQPGMTGAAWRLYPRTSLVLHTHMQLTGKPETVQFQVGIHYAKQSPTQRPVMMRIGSRDIDIKPGDSHYVAADEYVVPVDLDIHSIFPHAHSLCRDTRVDAILPDGSTKPLIWIKDFDEKWHDNYRFAQPVRVPRGSKLRSSFTYDNSDQNIRNRHHPPVRTVYGPNIVDEMEDVYMQVTTVFADERAAFMEDLDQYDSRSQIVGFNKTLEMYPKDPWSQEGLAACYISLGKPKEAVQLLEERLKLGSDQVYPTVSLGLACLAAGDPARAEKLEREAIVHDANYPLAWFGLGRALDAGGDAGPSEQSFRRAAELAPAMTDAHVGLADSLAKQKKLAEALAACQEAIKLSPDTASLYLKLAGFFAREHRYGDCLRNLEEAQRLAPYTHPPKVLLAVFYQQNGETQQAKRLLGEAHADSPTHPVPELFLAQYAVRDKQWEAARKYLAAAASRPIPPNWPESHKKRFLVLLHTERFKLAQQLQDEELAKSAVSEWIKYDPDNRQLQEIYNSLHPTGIQ